MDRETATDPEPEPGTGTGASVGAAESAAGTDTASAVDRGKDNAGTLEVGVVWSAEAGRASVSASFSPAVSLSPCGSEAASVVVWIVRTAVLGDRVIRVCA